MLCFLVVLTNLKKIISDRPESKMIKSISVVKLKLQKEWEVENDVYVCGLVTTRNAERNITKLVLEDPSGSFEGIIFDEELQKTAGTLLIDQFVIARVSTSKNSGLIIKDLIFPDIPDQKINKSESEVYAVFLSDLHIGSKYFMEEELTEFVTWLSSPDPVARRVRFVLIGGDIVDGVGIYPNQNKELVCQTIEEQLQKAENLLDKIPKNIKIIIMPGNHDPGRRALPQPAIPKKYNSGLWERENIKMVGNPTLVSLNGVKVLMFHGQSIDDIVKTTPGLSYDRPTDVMKNLLRARHLSPIYGSATPIAPEVEDLLVIEEIPDIFHVGHVHRAQLDMYKGILLVNSGSWQKQTPFQASVGMTPNPGLAIIVNLKTFQVFHENYNSNSNNVLQS
jgi:Archaeal DNA polymerase II, small subunit/DNA polymerase delta, subunit B